MKLSLTFLTLFLIASFASGEDLQLQNKAKSGDLASQTQYGILLAASDNAESQQQGIKWLERAARGGSIVAYYDLGAIYQEGKLKKRDIQRAIFYLSIASELGEVRAMNRLAGIYYLGNDVPQDRVEALKWTLVAASMGNKFAQMNLKSITDESTQEEKELASEASLNWTITRTGQTGKLFIKKTDPK